MYTILTPMLKTCSKCKTEKASAEFLKGRTWCRKCKKAYQKEYNAKNKGIMDIYGYIGLEETHRLENGEVVLGCITTKYRRNGEIISRTESGTMTTHEARGLGARDSNSKWREQW